MRAVITVTVAAILGLGVAACSSTRAVGADAGQGMAVIVPETQINRVRAASPFNPPCTTGEVRVRICGSRLGGARRFQVPAGRRDLQVVYLNDDTPFETSYDDMVLRTEAVILSFDAQAGHTYAVRGAVDWRGGGEARPLVTLWIVDGATGGTVTSVVVPDANVRVEHTPLPFGG